MYVKILRRGKRKKTCNSSWCVFRIFLFTVKPRGPKKGPEKKDLTPLSKNETKNPGEKKHEVWLLKKSKIEL